MQIAEILVGALRAFQRIDIRLQLNQVARHEPRREPEMARHIAPAARPSRGRSPTPIDSVSSGVCTPGFHADQVTHALLQAEVETDQEVDGALGLLRQRGDEFGHQRTGRLRRQIRGEVEAQIVGIDEREPLRIGLDEEVERIDDRQVGGEIDLDPEFVGLFRKYQPRQPVAVRVLLPVDEVLRGAHRKRVTGDLGAAMRCRPQPDDLRPEPDQAVIFVGSDVVERDEDRHG